MKFLIDTQLLLWAAIAPQRLSSEARELLEDAGNDLLFSAASF
jgi:PIN domain nuclease of toxin-antitoxin system